jgi:hypothetical protein
MMRRTTLRFALTILFLVAGPLAWQTGPVRAQADDDAETFQQLLEEEQDRPRVFGPDDGDLVHSADGLVIAPATETLTLRDLAVHVEFINPYDASTHSWDYGIGFRVNDNSFYWVGVFAGGAEVGPSWLHAQGRNELLDVQAAPDLDQSDGGTNTLDLIAVGETGYFGINGTFVGTLDLSAHQETGGIAIGTSFIEESFVDGEQTGYTNFTVWSFDEAAAQDATPTRTPRARTATPQTLGRTPTVEAATPTPEDDVPNGVDGTTYTSPTFGYTLSWDETWEVLDAFVANLDDDDASNDEDVLTLSNGVSDVDIRGSQATGTPEECVASVEAEIERSGAESEVGVNADGTPIQESDSSFAYAVYIVTVGEGEDEQVIAWYAECRLLDSDVMVKLQQVVVIDSYNDQLDARAAVFDSLQMPEPPEPTATATRTPRPTRPPTEAPTEAPTEPPADDPTATPEDDPTEEPANGETVGMKLAEQNGSGVSGLATLSANGDETDVNVLILGAPDGALLLIHEGTCDALSPAPAFLLRDLDQSGASVTTINATLEELRAGGYAIALHEGVNDLSRPLACGEIPEA